MGAPRVRRVSGSRAATACLALLGLLGPGGLLAACGAGPARTGPVPGDRPAAAHPASRAPSATGHAVAAPGPFRPPLHSADIMVVAQQTLSTATVRRVRRLAGVSRVVRFSLAQVSVEDHAISVAAVDPATYRSFNPAPVAQFQPEWTRVAGGELALRPGFRGQVAADGYVALGGRSDAPRIHVGVYAPQLPEVDAVVNDTWVPALGMRPGNALLVSTGIRSPASVRGSVQRVVGRDTTVERLDVAARLGLDPRAVQTAILVGGPSVAIGSYSYRVLRGDWIRPDPTWVATHISTETMPIIGPMTCNTDLFPQLRAALLEVVARGLASAIHPGQYGGCYVPKLIPGTTVLSNHAFGLAFDLNVPENERGTRGRINRQVVAILERWGFTWGGTWHYTDPMHFEANRIVHPG